ncbi:retrovirus-related pol polyprotein from transposon TNT 1-94 [Tanacetum coccineum]
MLKDSIDNGPYQLKPEITVKDTYGVTDIRPPKKVEDLVGQEKLRYDSDIKAVNILLLGFLCIAKKRVKDFEWFKDKMLLAQAQKAGVVLNEEQQNLLADSLEETDDCGDLQLQATTNFKANHVDAYDSNCDDEATANSIFMVNLSPVNSINDDTVEPRYDSDILSKGFIAEVKEMKDILEQMKDEVEQCSVSKKYCNANVTNIALTKNCDTVCLSCNECLFSANHDACVVQYLKKMKKHKVAKSAKQKIKSEWKPIGQIFKIVGLKWIPTGRIFNLVGKPCPPSKDTSAIVVPLGHILTTTVILVDILCPKLSLRYTNSQESFSKCMLNTEFHPFNLHDFGIERIIRDEELPPWKFDYLGIVEIVLCNYGILRSTNGKYSYFTCVDLLSGSRGSNLYTISMAYLMKSSPICLLSKASKTKSWLWHHRHSHLNFGTINQLAKQGLVKGLPKLKYTKDHLCLACQMGKIKKESYPHNPEPSINEKLQMLHMDLYGPMRVGSINGKKYILVIVDDYSWFTWVKFLRTKDEAGRGGSLGCLSTLSDLV